MNLSTTVINGTGIEEDLNAIEIQISDIDLWICFAVSLLGLVILIGCTGNIMVILAVRKIKKLQTVSNIFIVNLSVCDLLFVGCVLPFNMYTYIVDGWYIAILLCKFVGFLGYTLTGTTIITITLIAYNRYKLVLDPGAYTELYTKRNIFIMLLAAWLVPVACLTPAIIGIWGTFGYVPMLVTCNLLLDHHSQLFKIFLMVVRAGLPCGLIVYFYARIYVATTTSHRRLHRNNRTFSAFELSKHRNSRTFSAFELSKHRNSRTFSAFELSKHRNSRTFSAFELSKHRNNRTFSAFELSKHKQEMHMTRMMLIIFLVFIISYVPCTITGLIDWSMILSKHFHMFCQISIYLGSAINPLVYGLMNSQFRQAYTEFICCFKREASTYNDTSTKFLRSSFLETNKILEPTESMPFTSKRLGSCTKSWFSKYHGTVKSQSMEQDIENSKDNSSSSENTPNLPLIEQF